MNLKLVIPSSKSNYVAVDRNFWIHAFGSRVAEIDVDEKWYLKKYQDVSSALSKRIIESARQHYTESGYFEHRMPHEISVDSQWYLAQYEDVGSAITQKVYRSAQEHFEEVGFKEGRLPYPGFSLSKRQIVVLETAR